MKKSWRVVLIIVIIAIAIGSVSAGVGVLTGADFERIGSVFQEQAAEKYNLDLHAFLHEWIPQSIAAIRDAFL
jgi:hypothetical protein